MVVRPLNFTVRGHVVNHRPLPVPVQRLWRLSATTLAGLLASCIIPGGEVPGLFYNVQLRDSRTDSVCLEFAGELAATASLRVVDQMLPTRPRGACIVELDNQEHSPRELVTIDWDPPSRTLGIHVKQAGTSCRCRL